MLTVIIYSKTQLRDCISFYNLLNAIKKAYWGVFNYFSLIDPICASEPSCVLEPGVMTFDESITGGRATCLSLKIPIEI